MPKIATAPAAASKSALDAAKAFLAEKQANATKLASFLRKADGITSKQHQQFVAAFRNVLKTSTAHKNALRAELRANLRTAAAGDEVSDDYADTADTLSQIINLAETGLDQLEDEDSAPDFPPSDDDDSSSEASVAAEDKTASGKTANDKTAEDTGPDGGPIEQPKGSGGATGPDGATLTKTASRHNADAILDKLIDGLTNLLEEVKSGADDAGDNPDDIVDIDQNGVVVDDEPVGDAVDDISQPEDPNAGEPAAPEDMNDTDVESALAAFLEGGAHEASADPYDANNQPDPLKGIEKNAADARQRQATQRRTARQRQDDQDTANLKLIAESLVR